MSTEAEDDDREWAEFDRLVRNPPVNQNLEPASDAEIAEMMEGLDDAVRSLDEAESRIPEATRIALKQVESRQNRIELRNLLDRASAIATRLDEPEVISFIQSALARLRE
jgi:hypothetical protein